MTSKQMNQRQVQLSEERSMEQQPRRAGGTEGLNPLRPEPSPTRRPCTHLLVHRPVIGVVAALGPIADGGLAEARLWQKAVVVLLALVLAGTGVGDVDATHELGVFCPVVEADPAAALHLGREGDRLFKPIAHSTAVSPDRSSDLPLLAPPNPHLSQTTRIIV